MKCNCHKKVLLIYVKGLLEETILSYININNFFFYISLQIICLINVDEYTVQDSYFVQCLFQGRLVFLQSGRGALHLRFLGLEIGHMSRQFLDSLVQQLFL